MSFQNQYSDLQSRYNQLKGKRDLLNQELTSWNKDLVHHQDEESQLTEAAEIIRIAGRKVQMILEYRISKLVTEALKTVFPDPYEFQMQFLTKGGRIEAKIILTKDGEEFDPMSATGGGVVDVVAFALRIGCYLISQPRTRPTIILDEPFRFVSKDLQPRIRLMLDKISSELGIQFLIVTHEEILAALPDET